LTALAEVDPSRKDVVVAEVGATAALVGLVLVFVGALVASYQTALGRVSKAAIAPFKQAAWIALGVGGAGVATLATGVAWLVVGGGTWFYIATLTLFGVTLTGLVGVAVYSVRVLLR
jgi:hypothetical protein